MRLKKGSLAKEFATIDVFENPIRLEDYRGKKLLLSFFRFAGCPFCNIRVNQQIERFETYHKMGLEMIAVFESPPEVIREYVIERQEGLQFPIISDKDNKMSFLYGVESSWFKFIIPWIIPHWDVMKMAYLAFFKKKFYRIKIDGDVARLGADFLIGPDLKIEHVYYGDRLGRHMPFEIIEDFIGLDNYDAKLDINKCK